MDEFKSKITDGDFIEYAEVHENFYGTLKSEVVDKINKGLDVVMDIDVQGADLVRACNDPLIQNALVDLFVTPSSEEELRNRLVGRQTDSEDVIATRMQNSLDEMQQSSKYSYLLVSADKETDFAKFNALLIAERLNQSRIK